MTHGEKAIEAIRGGAEYLADIAHAMRVDLQRASGVMFLLFREGIVHREFNRWRGNFRYRMPDNPDLIRERQERVQRMIEWTRGEAV